MPRGLLTVHPDQIKYGREQLTQGCFGKTMQATMKVSTTKEKQVTVAKYSRSLMDASRFIDTPNQFYKARRGEGVLRIIGLMPDPQSVCVIFEGTMCNVRSFLEIRRDQLKRDPEDLFNLVKDIGYGMEELEKHSVVHGDLCAANCLIKAKRDEYYAKVALPLPQLKDPAKFLNYEDDYPLRWSSPELINSHRRTFKSDAWAFGVTAWEIYSFGEHPYGDMKNKDVEAFLRSDKRLPMPKECPQEIYKMMLQCWDFNATKRIKFLTLADLLEKYFDENFSSGSSSSDSNCSECTDISTD